MDKTQYRRALGRPYIYILFISIILTLLFSSSKFIYEIPGESWLQGLAITSLGSYITAVLVDLSFRRKEEREKKRVKRIVLRQLSGIIHRHIDHLSNWYIGALYEYPKTIPTKYSKLFDEEYIETVKKVDFSENYPTAGPRDPTWMAVSNHHMNQFSEDINEIISKYSLYLNSDMIKTLQNLADSPITNIFDSDMMEYDKRKGVKRDYNILNGGNVDIYLSEHLDLVLEVIEWFENDSKVDIISVEDLDAWRDDVSPQAGSAKIEKELEQTETLYGMGPSDEK